MLDDRKSAPVNAYHGRLKQWLNRFNGVATQNLPNYLDLAAHPRSPLRQTTPQSWIKGAIEMARINSYRYKSRQFLAQKQKSS